MRLWIMAMLAITSASVAQAAPHPLEVPANAIWKHALTGLLLRPQLAGLRRESIRDIGEGEVDVAVAYGDGKGTIATLYLYRAGVADVPIWFDRSDSAIRSRTVYGTVGAASAEAFSSVVGGAADSLRIVYPLSGKELTATGLAAMPLSDWLVTIRLSSSILTPDALRGQLDRMVAAIDWPSGRIAGPVAAPILACSDPRRFKKAKLAQPDMTQMLLQSVADKFAVTHPKEGKQESVKLTPYCRETSARDQSWASYRPAEPDLGYLIGMGDAGRVIRVRPTPSLTGKALYAIALLDLDKIVHFAMPDRLPPPEQAIEVVSRTRPISVISRSGNDQVIQVAPR